MIKDRGNIKWTALMLSEHREALKKLKDEEGEESMPELDPQQLEELDFLLERALREGSELRLTYFSGKRFHSLQGAAAGISPRGKELLFRSGGGAGRIEAETIRVPLEKITEINIIK